MGTSIVIPGADFSQSGILTKNFVEMYVTEPGYVYYGGDVEVYSGDFAVCNWSSKVLVEEGAVRLPLYDANGKNFHGFDFKYEKVDSDFVLVRPNYPTIKKIRICGDLPQNDYSLLFLAYNSNVGIEEADFSGLTRNGGQTIIGFKELLSNQHITVFKQPNQAYNIPVASFRYNPLITSLDLSNAYNIDINAIFNGCNHLQSIDFSNLQVANIIQDRNGFSGCTALTSIKVTNASATAKANLITKLADVGFTFVEQGGYLIKQ